MKIAIPVKTNKDDTSVTPVFGKAKWFAFIEDKKITIEKNEQEDGAGVIGWLLRENVTSLIVKHISKPPYNMTKKDGRINIFYAGDEKKLGIKELVEKFNNNQLKVVDDDMSEVIKDHQREHKNR